MRIAILIKVEVCLFHQTSDKSVRRRKGVGPYLHANTARQSCPVLLSFGSDPLQCRLTLSQH